MRNTTDFLGGPSGKFRETSGRVNEVEGVKELTRAAGGGRRRLTLVVVGTWQPLGLLVDHHPDKFKKAEKNRP